MFKIEISSRIKLLRKTLSLTQASFSNKIKIGQTTLAQFENGTRNIKDIHIKRICEEFNVNEEWLRYGTGDMFISRKEISLDDFAKQNNATKLEIELMKAYLSIPPENRSKVINAFKETLKKETEDEEPQQEKPTWEESTHHNTTHEDKGTITNNFKQTLKNKNTDEKSIQEEVTQKNEKEDLVYLTRITARDGNNQDIYVNKKDLNEIKEELKRLEKENTDLPDFI